MDANVPMQGGWAHVEKRGLASFVLGADPFVRQYLTLDGHILSTFSTAEGYNPLATAKETADVRGADVRRTKTERKERPHCVRITFRGTGKKWVLGWKAKDVAEQWLWLDRLHNAGADTSTLQREMNDAAAEAKALAVPLPDRQWVHAAIDRTAHQHWAGLLSCILARRVGTVMPCELLNERPAKADGEGGRRWGTILHQLAFAADSRYASAAFRKLVCAGCNFDLSVKSGEHENIQQTDKTVVQLVEAYPNLEGELARLWRQMQAEPLPPAELNKPAFSYLLTRLQEDGTSTRGILKLHVTCDCAFLEFKAESGRTHAWKLPYGVVDCSVHAGTLAVRVWDDLKTSEGTAQMENLLPQAPAPVDAQLVSLVFQNQDQSVGPSHSPDEKLHDAEAWLWEQRKWAEAAVLESWSGITMFDARVRGHLAWQVVCSPQGEPTRDPRNKIKPLVGDTKKGCHTVAKVRWKETSDLTWSEYRTPFEVTQDLQRQSQSKSESKVALDLDQDSLATQVHPGDTRGEELLRRMRQNDGEEFTTLEAIQWIKDNLFLDLEQMQKHLERAYQLDQEIVKFERGTTRYEINLHKMTQTNIADKMTWEWKGDENWERYGPNECERLESAYNGQPSNGQVSNGMKVDVGGGRHVDMAESRGWMWQVVTADETRRRPVRRCKVERSLIRTESEPLYGVPAPVKPIGHAGVLNPVAHNLTNETAFALTLVDYSLQCGRWFSPPPGMAFPGKNIHWSICSDNGHATGFIVYDLVRSPLSGDREPISTLKIQLGCGQQHVSACLSEPRHEPSNLPQARNCQRRFCVCCRSSDWGSVAGLPAPHNRLQIQWSWPRQAVLAGTTGSIKWKLTETSRYEKPSGQSNPVESTTLCTPRAGVGDDESSACVDTLIGFGSTFIGLCWEPVTTIAYDVVPTESITESMRQTLDAQIPMMEAKRGDKLVVLDDQYSDHRDTLCSDFAKVRRYGTREIGYVPACTLVDDQVHHDWHIEVKSLGGADRGAAKRIRCEPYLNRSGSLFELDQRLSGGSFSEWRAECRYVDGAWQAIVRGLHPGVSYEFCVCPSDKGPADSKPVKATMATYAPWHLPMSKCSITNNALHQQWKKMRPSPHTVKMTERHQNYDVKTRQLTSKYQKRWARIRPESNWNGMDVLWALQSKSQSSQTDKWRVTVVVESMSGSSSEERRELQPIEGDLQWLSGRIRVKRNEMVRLEFVPLTGGSPKEVECCWLAQSNEDVLQSTIPVGRFVRLDVDDQPIEVSDVKVFDVDRRPLKVVGAAMGSAASVWPNSKEPELRWSFPGENSFDGQLGTACRTRDTGHQWLRLDLGSAKQVGCVEVVHRITPEPRFSMAGVTVSITQDASPSCDASNAAWHYVHDGGSDDANCEGPGGNRWLYRYQFGSDDGGTLCETKSIRSVAHETMASFSAEASTFPAEHFQSLIGYVRSLTAGDEEVSRPSAEVNISSRNIMMPFNPSTKAETFQVYRLFASKAKPYWVKFKDAEGKVVDTVLKQGDDVRQDQLVLAMLEYFNFLWRTEGVVHVTSGGDRVAVAAPIYRVAASGQNDGLLEMLPKATPVDKVDAKDSRGENGWKASKDMIPSAVAAFIGAHALCIRDRHTGNMVITEGKLANIDFGWFGEEPGHDTGRFPIPDGLQYLLKHTQRWGEFYDLCWDATWVLNRHINEIENHFQTLLKALNLDADAALYENFADSIRERISLFDRQELDEQLEGTFVDNFRTAKKALLHGPGKNVLDFVKTTVSVISKWPSSPQSGAKAESDEHPAASLPNRSFSSQEPEPETEQTQEILVPSPFRSSSATISRGTRTLGIVYAWTVTELSAWLVEEMKLPEVASGVTSQDVDGGAALELARDDWIELGASGIQAGKIISKLKKLEVQPVS